MKLITAHRILIAAGIAFFALFALLGVRRYVTGGADVAPLIQAIVSAAIVLGLAVYYRTLRNWGRR